MCICVLFVYVYVCVSAFDSEECSEGRLIKAMTGH